MTDIIHKWVEALRSGKYVQTKGRLADDHGYCCLGVLCELAIEDGLPVIKSISGDYGCFFYDDAMDVLPKSVAKWAGVNIASNYVDEYGIHRQLSEENDSGKTFAEIADIIEKEPSGLMEDQDLYGAKKKI